MAQGYTSNFLLDNDVTLASDSVYIAPTVHAAKTYVDNKVASQAIVDAGTNTTLFITPAGLASTLLARNNYIINGGFEIAQRGTNFDSTTTPANSDDTFCLDRWNLLSDGNNIAEVSQQSASPPNFTRYFCQLIVKTANKKFGTANYLEAANTIPLRGQKVSLSFQAKTTANAINNIRVGILEWTGSADSITSDVVSSWAAAGTDPTLVANWAYLNTPGNLGLTTSWQTFKVEGITVGASATNLAVFVWSDDTTTTATDVVHLGAVKLEPNATASPYMAADIEIERARCQRYCWVLQPTTAFGVLSFMGIASSTTSATVPIPLKVTMRAAPSLVIPVAAGQYRANINTATVATLTALAINANNTNEERTWLDLTVSTGFAVGDRIFLQANNNTGAWLMFEAEL